MGTFPPTKYETTAKRWYKQRVDRAKEDAGLWMREEKITGTISGDIALDSKVEQTTVLDN